MANLGQGLQGAIGGGMAGGSLPGAGILGVGVGAILGGLGGLFGDQERDDYIQRAAELEQEFAGRNAPQSGAAFQGNTSDVRGRQMNYLDQLQAQYEGRGPSLAGQQLQQGADAAIASQNSLMASAAGRGVNQGAAFRQASNNTAAIQGQTSRDAALARTQEQLNAGQLLGANLANTRSTDEQMSQFNAVQGNNVMLANLDAQLRAMGMNDSARLQAMQMAMGGAGQPGTGTGILGGGTQMLGQFMAQRAARNGGSGSGSAGSTQGQDGMGDNLLSPYA